MFGSKQSKGPLKSRDDLLEKARLEREARQSEKRRNASAVIIQACILFVVGAWGDGHTDICW